MARRKKRKAAAPPSLSSDSDPLAQGVDLQATIDLYLGAANRLHNAHSNPAGTLYQSAFQDLTLLGNTLSLIAAFHPEFGAAINAAFQSAQATISR